MTSRYSRNVILFRWALISAMTALIVTAVVWAWPKPEAPVLTQLPPKNELAAPRFIIKQGAYTHVLTGTKADYSQDQQIVNLQNAHLASTSAQQLVTITTPEGVYNKQTALITMHGDVVLTASASQLRLEADQGQADTKSHIINVEDHVHGETPTMQIQSDTADYEQDKQLINFRGNVHAVLQP